jgi:hypothetical protein
LRFGGRAARDLVHVAPLIGNVGIAAAWRLSEVGGSSPSCVMQVCRSERGNYGMLLGTANHKLFKDHGTRPIQRFQAASPSGAWHTARLVRVRHSLEAWVNGKLQLRVSDPDHNAGVVAIGSWNANVAFRALVIVGRIDPDWLADHPVARQQIAAAPIVRSPEALSAPAAKPAK